MTAMGQVYELPRERPRLFGLDAPSRRVEDGLYRSLQEADEQVARLKHELAEANAEIARHHRGFAQVSVIVDVLLSDFGARSVSDTVGLLKRIRGIVG